MPDLLTTYRTTSHAAPSVLGGVTSAAVAPAGLNTHRQAVTSTEGREVSGMLNEMPRGSECGDDEAQCCGTGCC